MKISSILNLVAFNSDMERFADIYGDSIDSEDCQDFAKTLYNLTGSQEVRKVNNCLDPSEAFDYLDSLAQDLEESARKESPVLSPVTVEVAKIVSYIRYSNNMAWFDDWDTIEEQIINYLPNNEVKNWEALDPEGDTEKNFNKIASVVASRFLKLLWDDLENAKIDIIDKFSIVQGFRDEYEPNISDSEGFGSEWFAFEGLLKSATYGELLDNIADWVNSLVFVEFDDEGQTIEGETVATDYFYLVSPLVAKCQAWEVA